MLEIRLGMCRRDPFVLGQPLAEFTLARPNVPHKTRMAALLQAHERAFGRATSSEVGCLPDGRLAAVSLRSGFYCFAAEVQPGTPEWPRARVAEVTFRRLNQAECVQFLVICFSGMKWEEVAMRMRGAEARAAAEHATLLARLQPVQSMDGRHER